MYKYSTQYPPSVLIVESGNGDVFIVENVKSETQVDKILKTENSPKKKPKRSPRKSVVKYEPQEMPPAVVKKEEKYETYDDDDDDNDGVIEEYLDECFEDDQAIPVSFVDPNSWRPPTPVLSATTHELKIKAVHDSYNMMHAPDVMLDHSYMIARPTFDGKYSSDEFDEPSDDDTLLETKTKIEVRNSGKPQRHKLRQLTGKSACKYCDTIFKSKESLKMHVCKYLQCDPKNFICRICKKELSKKTFSNHLHETLACQYCGKKFVNPRNMKTHIKTIHGDEKFIPPKSPDLGLFENFENQDETAEPVLDETTGLLVLSKAPRKKYPRKTGRYECDLCGRLFTTVRSLQIHMDLHTNSHRYICQTCGEKYTTHTGITKHACLNKKRKRPEVDFRIFDVRHCKYCGRSFSCLEETKAHACEFQFVDEPKMFRCRFCYSDMSKNSYNKHMTRHIEPTKEWICSFCDKKLSDEIGLNIHMTTHTGDKPFKCPYEDCEQSFINRQLLVRHSRFHGVDIPVYTCSICHKEVASKYHLKTHMKLHADTVECQLCKLMFATKENLKEHYQSAHLPFPCAYCDKSFTLPRYKKMHEKLHTPSEPKPHKCEFCVSSKAFSKVALLLNHIYKVHNESFDDWKESHPEIFK